MGALSALAPGHPEGVHPHPMLIAGPRKPLVGVIHLPALPGAPRYTGPFGRVIDDAVRDTMALAEAGFDAVLVENFGDAPFYRGKVPAETVAAMAVVTDAVRRAGGIPVGVNVLRNDGESAMAIAVAAGARFIRVNVLVGARVTDQGVIEGAAAELLRTRARLSALGVLLVADVGVKHSSPLGASDLGAEASEAVERALADVLVVTGTRTGAEANRAAVATVRTAVPGVPIWLGSGAKGDTLASWLDVVDGVIVGSALRADGRAGGPVDPARCKAFAARR